MRATADASRKEVSMPLQGKDQILFQCILAILLFIIYAPPSWIAFNNIKFRMPIRIIFSFTFVPLFFVIMAVMLFIVPELFPFVVSIFDSLSEGYNNGNGQAIAAISLTCPIAILGCYIWYKFLKYLNKKFDTGRCEQ